MFEALKQKLEGCIYTVFTPFDDRENIDFKSLEKYLTMLYSGGARKFYVMAYNSRYSQLNDNEILELNKFTIETVKNLDQNNIVIVADPIHCSTNVSIEFSRHAKDFGADLISLIFREKYFSDEQVLDHFDQISRTSNMPILIHEMPFLSGYDGSQMHWPNSLFEKLPSIRNIVALKEDAKNFDITSKALELEPRIRVIIAGSKKNLLAYKNLGAMSYLNGISIIDAKIGEYFWKAWTNNDKGRMDNVINKLETPFFEKIVSKFGWHRANKALLEAAGLMSRRDRMPLQHINDTQQIEVNNLYLEIKDEINNLK